MRKSFLVAFTPKGGCPLKREIATIFYDPLELQKVAFTPKGGCPLKRELLPHYALKPRVAFTPKGGCPLKLTSSAFFTGPSLYGSIHP